jgi:hypothetical protein
MVYNPFECFDRQKCVLSDLGFDSGNVSNLPPRSQWVNFYHMFGMNQAKAMAWTGNPASTPEQRGEIYNAILSISKASKVDPRLILAVIIQEVSIFFFLSYFL